MLKAILENLDGVDENLQSFYTEKDGQYHLQVDGLEDTGALKRAKDHEKTARQDAERKASELQAQLEEVNQKLSGLNDETNRKNGDVEALERSWQEKLTKREGELQGKIDSLSGNLNEMLVDNVAIKMASELAVEGSSGVLLPHIQKRLATDERDGKLTTIVLDNSGKPSATTLDELREEISSAAAFAPVIVGSKASGGGAGQGSGGGASNSGDLAKMSRAEKLEYFDKLNN